MHSIIIPFLFLVPLSFSFRIQDKSYDCGRSHILRSRSGRIVNGKYTSYAEFPWMVALNRNGLTMCGATLIDANWVLTAAHCVEGFEKTAISLLIAEHNLDHQNEAYPHQERNITKMVIHPKYDHRLEEGNDLALLKMEKPVQFGPTIQPICLPGAHEAKKNLVGRMALIAGWGRLYHEGKYASILRKAAVPIMRNKICEKMYFRKNPRFNYRFTDDFICAGYKNGKKSSCHGDSGGPLQLRRSDGSWYLAGVTSWSGPKCAHRWNPVLYMNISKFLTWIDDVMTEQHK